MKKFNTNRLVALLACLCLITSCFVGTTLAKYTSEKFASDTASVAKWSFTVDGADITTTDFTFDLFNTIKEADTATTEEHVKAGLIAPGTGGSFVLKLNNASEVDAKYSIAYEVTTNAGNIPVEFTLDKDDADSWKSDITELNVTDVNVAKETAVADITVYWRWAFEGTSSKNFQASQTDVTDTALGVAAQTADNELTVKATISATQVD